MSRPEGLPLPPPPSFPGLLPASRAGLPASTWAGPSIPRGASSLAPRRCLSSHPSLPLCPKPDPAPRRAASSALPSAAEEVTCLTDWCCSRLMVAKLGRALESTSRSLTLPVTFSLSLFTTTPKSHH
uniref:Uncharacterized protein n=1 Tax=Rousettus aegyptiacus TaxID=9407 RepID=A0A7J8DIP0_ROUAE|nr:hypothetical protein HJG63_008684 [Rousettus aegyptiacus]